MTTADPDFSRCMAQVRNVYIKHDSLSDKKTYNNVSKATSEVASVIRSIEEQTTQDVSFAAKQDAVSVLVQIGHEIIEGKMSLLRSEMRKDLWNMPVGPTIEQIFTVLSPVELAALQADGEMAKDLCKLRRHAKQYGEELYSLDDCINVLTLEESDSEDDASGDRMSL